MRTTSSSTSSGDGAPLDPRLAVLTEGIGKRYTLGQLRTLQQRVAGLVDRARGRTPLDRGFRALEDISVEIRRGECFGILGLNGSGKSTFVQVIAGITVPTAGRAVVQGRVLPLLEVGAGFHAELTGRENVILFGTILGLTPAEIEEAMPHIREFAELDEAHFETPLKRYSTGMQARLSFAVAMRFPADVYIFDEVMAVVDDYYRAMAIHEVERLITKGRTVIFISHDLRVVRSLCHRGMWLDSGRMRALGPIEEVADAYSRAQMEELDFADEAVAGDAALRG